MNPRLLHDMSLRPELFHWNGPISRARLQEWLAERSLKVPDDLFELWLATGGGDLFETETVLGPFGDPSAGDDVDSVNRRYRARGLALDHLIVHVGLTLTVVRLKNGHWVAVDERTHEPLAEYDGFEAWYEALREEYADRYGLPP